MKSRTTRTIAMTVAAGITAALIPAAVALHDSMAIADPAPPTATSAAPTAAPASGTAAPTSGTAAPSAGPTDRVTTGPAQRVPSQLGTANLLQYNDLNNNTGLGYLPHATIGDDHGEVGLSACTGEQSMADVAGADTDRFHAAWTSGASPFSVTEIAAGLGDQAHARTTMATLVRGQRACQDEPAGHWRYGAEHTVRAGTGTATWFAATDGDGTRNGGVIVARNGLHVAVVEVTGKSVSDAGMAQLARDTVIRLA